jgi:hypothetical protein
MSEYVYAGLLSLGSWGEADNVLFLVFDGRCEPLAQLLEWMSGATVTVGKWLILEIVAGDETRPASGGDRRDQGLPHRAGRPRRVP